MMVVTAVATAYLMLAGWALLTYLASPLPKVFWLPPPIPLLMLVFHPNWFWRRLRKVAEASPEGAVCFQLLGMRGVLFTDRALIRGTTREGHKTFKIFAHPNAKWLFYTDTQQNLIILPNDLHAKVRAQYQLFLSMEALKTNNSETLYAWQRAWIDRTLGAGNDEASSTDVNVRVWSQGLLAHTILSNICPKFQALSLNARTAFCRDIQTFTMGFLSLPVPYRPFGLGRAVAAGERIIALIHEFMAELRMQDPQLAKGRDLSFREETKDEASQSTAPSDIVSSEGGAAEKGGFLGRWLLELDKTNNAIQFTDRDVAINLLDMAFAAQDATNSALCFCVAYFASNPDALKRLKGQAYDSADVTNFVVNLLNAKPPVPMTLRTAMKTTALTASNGNSVPIRKGELIVHSIEGVNKVWHQDGFDAAPDMFSPAVDDGFVDSMVFGSGAHKCPGKSYAVITLQTFVTAFADAVDKVEPVDYDPGLMYYPTLFPKKSTFRFHKATTTSLPKASPNEVVGDVLLGVVQQ